MIGTSFQPHPFFPGGHLQTLAGFYLPSAAFDDSASRHVVELDDGDALVVHDDQPPAWRNGDPTVLLIHGLAGCHRSSYMQRATSKLTALGVRVFRMDMRGCGAGVGLAKRTTHCGRSGDAAAAIERVAKLCPHSPTLVIGYSLGGAIALNLVGEQGGSRCGNLTAVLAICPPIDLPANSRYLESSWGRPYDHFFVHNLWRSVLDHLDGACHELRIDPSQRPRRLRELDALVTAPLGGFRSVDDYYEQASPGPKLIGVQVPTCVLAAEDDPVVCVEPLQSLPVSSAVRVVITRSGGHLGFISRRLQDPDRRWLDWRIVDWVVNQQSLHRNLHPVHEHHE